MRKKTMINRMLNIVNVFISIVVFGTGIILFTRFHVGDGASRTAWLGFGKNVWLIIHQISALGFCIGFVAHIQLHWKYIKAVAKQWRNLPQKTKSRTRLQVVFLIMTLIIVGTGFYPWIAMPGATLEVEVFHAWIDVHIRVGFFGLVGLIVHIIRRWRRCFRVKRGSVQ